MGNCAFEYPLAVTCLIFSNIFSLALVISPVVPPERMCVEFELFVSVNVKYSYIQHVICSSRKTCVLSNAVYVRFKGLLAGISSVECCICFAQLTIKDVMSPRRPHLWAFKGISDVFFFFFCFCPEDQSFHLPLGKMTGFKLLTQSINLPHISHSGVEACLWLQQQQHVIIMELGQPHMFPCRWLFFLLTPQVLLLQGLGVRLTLNH